MLTKLTTLIGALLILCTAIVAQPDITLETHGISPREAQLDSNDIFEYQFSGLTNVGVGTMVYFKVTTDSTFENPTWTLPSSPAGSGATFGDAIEEDDMIIIQFTPDVAGQYTIEFGDLGLTQEVVINAANYLGVNGGTVGCGTCHGEATAAWQETGHYSIMEEGLNGTLSSHYRESCLSCHSTGYDTNPTAVNGGFDDLEFTFPDSLYEGAWDDAVAAYPEAMGLARIQCESCHGPGENHMGDISDSKMVSSLESDNCAYCHDDGHYHVFPEQWDLSQHAKGDFVGYAGTRSYCVPCHSGSAFVAWVKAGQQSPDELPPAIEITCATCHDPHDNTNEYQLRLTTASLANGYELTLGAEGKLCINCHKSRRDAIDYTDNYLDNLSSHFGPHHGPQGDMLVGQNAVTWGYEINSSPHLQALDNACVGCHMADAGTDDEGHPIFAGSHTFAMVTPDGEDNVAACTDCHGDIGESFDEKKLFIDGMADHDGDGVDEGLQEEVHGLLDQILEYIPHDEEGHPTITDSTVTKLQAQAAYNYLLMYEDRSFGHHNPRFIVGLAKLTLGVLNGSISDVAPEDGQIPVEFALEQNYPNPFNPTTTIKFSIPKASDVTLTVYDALGREVAKLVNEQLTAGKHSVDWNASNNASGIYFYRIATDQNVQVKKMVLVK